LIASFSLELAMYLLLFFLPGYIAYGIAGNLVSGRGSLLGIIIRGSTVFLLVTALALTFSRNTILGTSYLALFNDINQLKWESFLVGIIAFVVTGVVLGMAELILEYKVAWFMKFNIKLFNIGQGERIEVAPGNSLKKMFLCYRIANVKPLIKVYFNSLDNIPVSGEVLKYSWNKISELLLREADTTKLIWIRVDDCKVIEFENTFTLSNFHNSTDSGSRPRRENYLDLIHPGLSKYDHQSPEN